MATDKRHGGDGVRTAVLGATGFVGRALMPALAQRGEVLAVSRRGATPDLPGVRAVAADVTDSIRGALEGVDVAYYLVHSLGARNFPELDRRAAENVAAEAERAGVAQIVYLGGLGEERPDLSAHLRSRIETAAVRRHPRQGFYAAPGARPHRLVVSRGQSGTAPGGRGTGSPGRPPGTPAARAPARTSAGLTSGRR